MKLSGQTIRRLGIVSPCKERTQDVYNIAVPWKWNRISTWRRQPPSLLLSYGLSPTGYDLRVEFDDTGEKSEVELGPRECLLASSMEYFRMPNNVVGIVHDKSTLVRRFLTVQNTVIESGWSGYLTLELINHSKRWIRLERGMPIAQVLFDFTDEPVEKAYEGKYQFQGRGPQQAK